MTRGRPFSFQKRLRIYWRDAFTCQYCQTALHPLSEDLTLDHADPDGSNDDTNLVTACRPCNSAKGNKTVRQMMQRESMLKALGEQPLRMQPEDIITLVCHRWHLTRDQLLSPRRKRQPVEARAELAHRLRENNWTLQAIADLLGKKDHSTISHLLKTYPRIMAVVDVDNDGSDQQF